MGHHRNPNGQITPDADVSQEHHWPESLPVTGWSGPRLNKNGLTRYYLRHHGSEDGRNIWRRASFRESDGEFLGSCLIKWKPWGAK